MGKDSLFADRRLNICAALILSFMAAMFLQSVWSLPIDHFRATGVILAGGFVAWCLYSLWSKGSAFLFELCHGLFESLGAIGIVVLCFALGIDEIINKLIGPFTLNKALVLCLLAAVGIPLFLLVRWFGRQVFGDE